MNILAIMTMTTTLAASGPDVQEERERAQKAAEVLDSIMAAPDREIPADLLAKAKGIAVIPNVVKGAFLAGMFTSATSRADTRSRSMTSKESP